MELQTINPLLDEMDKPFIVANTLPCELEALRQEHIIPVFTKDNHPLISQSQLIEITGDVLSNFHDFRVSKPQIRVSHPIMGRIPEARNKRAVELLPHEKTLYYERMMYLYQIGNIKSVIQGQELSLVVGGVKSYSWDNLSKDNRAHQHFKFFVGFQVWVCSNLCICSDGVVLDLKANSLRIIAQQIKLMIEKYQFENHLNWMEELGNYSLTESQFAHFIGKCRMYPHHPERDSIPEILITDAQINSVVRGYFSDPNFSSKSGEISLWNLYNLMTEANKSSYIDGFIDRGVNGDIIIKELAEGKAGRLESWLL
ncbi:MAG: DUF3871 family protein [Saprospiraceae bacterium]|nr:DUF3871 family protein [Saprospiraceae bacterium]